MFTHRLDLGFFFKDSLDCIVPLQGGFEFRDASIQADGLSEKDRVKRE